MFQILLFGLVSFLPGDSLRMEVINGKPHVVHQVGEKETLYSLSKRYGSTVADILSQNPTADAGIEVGQILKIPYGGRAKAPVTTKTTEGIIHRVAAKETLFSIARHYNVSVDDIRAWNHLTEPALSVGQEILIRQKTEAPVTEVKPVQHTSAKTHTVAPKETLYSISHQYGMTVDQLREWNSITGNELRIGQVLTVAAPSPSATAPVVIATAPVVIATAPVVTTTVPLGTTIPAGTTSVPAGTTIAPAVTVPAQTSPVVVHTEPAPVPTVAPATQPAGTVKISEGLSGANELKEVGMAALLAGTDGTRKYLAHHATIKPGTILKIRNLTTNQEVFVRVTGPPAVADPTTVILISKSAFDRLGATEAKFRAEITYYK